MEMAIASGVGRLIGIAPQFLVDDLRRSIDHYVERLGYQLDFVHDAFYASVSRDGCQIHLKAAPKIQADRAHRRQHEHLDAYIKVSGIADLFSELQNRGATVIRPLEHRPWACRDFYVEDPDGYILCFSEPVELSSGVEGNR
jgi:uncharacterized glyoxalase superfamily protein PhnB